MRPTLPSSSPLLKAFARNSGNLRSMMHLLPPRCFRSTGHYMAGGVAGVESRTFEIHEGAVL
jgi:hypothetical protein